MSDAPDAPTRATPAVAALAGASSGDATSTDESRGAHASLRSRAGARPACFFLCAGEGVHSATTELSDLELSPSWSAAEAALLRLGIARSLRAFLRARLGVHAASGSPLVTTIINVLNADRWRAAGHWPSL